MCKIQEKIKPSNLFLLYHCFGMICSPLAENYKSHAYIFTHVFTLIFPHEALCFFLWSLHTESAPQHCADRPHHTYPPLSLSTLSHSPLIPAFCVPWASLVPHPFPVSRFPSEAKPVPPSLAKGSTATPALFHKPQLLPLLFAAKTPFINGFAALQFLRILVNWY